MIGHFFKNCPSFDRDCEGDLNFGPSLKASQGRPHKTPKREIVEVVPPSETLSYENNLPAMHNNIAHTRKSTPALTPNSIDPHIPSNPEPNRLSPLQIDTLPIHNTRLQIDIVTTK